MKHLTGRHTTTTRASPDRVLELAGDLEGYPRWFGSVVPRVEPLAGGRMEVTLEAHIGPLHHRFTFAVDVEREGDDTVRLRRVPFDAGDDETFVVTWRTGAPGPPTPVEVDLEAGLDVPALLPVRGLGSALAGRLAQAAVRELDG